MNRKHWLPSFLLVVSFCLVSFAGCSGTTPSPDDEEPVAEVDDVNINNPGGEERLEP